MNSAEPPQQYIAGLKGIPESEIDVSKASRGSLCLTGYGSKLHLQTR